jgi:hypothetical protein
VDGRVCAWAATSGDQRGWLDISAALLASETGWVPLQSQWDLARALQLRLMWSIHCARDDSPARFDATADDGRCRHRQPLWRPLAAPSRVARRAYLSNYQYVLGTDARKP